MPTYPLSVFVPSSLTRKSHKSTPIILRLRESAKKIENYINDRSKNSPETIFNYHEIANDLGIDKENIRRFLSPIGGGSNGITVRNPMLDKKNK